MKHIQGLYGFFREIFMAKDALRSCRMWGLGLFTALSLLACDGGGGDASSTPTTPATAVAGKALDESTGLGIAGVTVRVGSLSTTTAADGSFTFTAPWGEPMVARPGDAIVRSPQDPADTYRIAAAAFACTYEILRPAP